MAKVHENSTSLNEVQNQQKARFPNELLPFEMGYLPPHFQRKVEVELHETAEKMQNGIRMLREMAKKDKNFVGQTFDDDLLVQFLRGQKYDVPKAFARLRKFVIMRMRNLEMFIHYNFESLSVATKKNVLMFLPWRCHEGCTIMYINFGNWDVNELPLEEFKRAIVVLMCQSLRDPMTQVNGFKVIANAECSPLKILRVCTPSNVYLLYHATQDCTPGRFKEIHIVNSKSLMFKLGYAFLSPFLSSKMKQRFIFHSGPETLTDYFPQSVLPKEYGGDPGQFDMTDWLRKVTQPDKLATIGGGPPPLPKHR